MIIELFYAEGCQQCLRNRETLKATAQQIIPDMVWREVNVLDEMDYAVELGILTLPAIVINKELVFTRLPSVTQLTQVIDQRITKAKANGN